MGENLGLLFIYNSRNAGIEGKDQNDKPYRQNLCSW